MLVPARLATTRTARAPNTRLMGFLPLPFDEIPRDRVPPQPKLITATFGWVAPREPGARPVRERGGVAAELAVPLLAHASGRREEVPAGAACDVGRPSPAPVEPRAASLADCAPGPRLPASLFVCQVHWENRSASCREAEAVRPLASPVVETATSARPRCPSCPWGRARSGRRC